MLSGDVIQVTLKGKAYEQDCLNVLHLFCQVVGPDEVPDPFDSDGIDNLSVVIYELLIEDLIPWVPPAVEWQSFDVYNLFNDTEMNSYAWDPIIPGTNAAEANASFVNPVIRSPTRIRGMHGGRKSLPPVSEAVSGHNEIVGGLVTSLNLMCDKFNLSGGYNITCLEGMYNVRPYVVRRIKEVDPEDPDHVTYRLPTTQAEREGYIAQNWQVRSTLGTTNTRKPGRGG